MCRCVANSVSLLSTIKSILRCKVKQIVEFLQAIEFDQLDFMITPFTVYPT